MKNLTLEQRQTLLEYDLKESELELKLKIIRERRREYLNTNQLNQKVGMIK